MKVEILPNVVNNLSALASLPEPGDIKIEYIAGGDDSDLIFIATSKTPITSLDNSEAQDSIYCDRDNKDSGRTINVSLGEQVYIWYKSTKTEKATLLVNANQNSATSSLNSVNSKSTQHGAHL